MGAAGPGAALVLPPPEHRIDNLPNVILRLVEASLCSPQDEEAQGHQVSAAATHEDQVWVVRSRGEEIARDADMTLAFGQARHWAAEQALAVALRSHAPADRRG